MNLKTIGYVLGITLLATACDKYKTKVTESGLKYQIFEHDEAARKAKLGDIMSFHLVLKNGADSTLRDTYKDKTPVKLVLQAPPFKGSFEEGLAMLAAGDSAKFFINADTLFAKMMQPLPPMIKKGSEITFTVKVLSVLTSEEFQKQQSEAGVKQKAIDEKVIQEYLAKNNLTAKAQHTASGLYYVDDVVGTGETPTQGDNVKVHYTGKLLDGKVFDSSKNAGKPIDFQVGVGMVIPGWEEGIMLMKKGGKRTLIIPSGLAYGVDGSPGAIPGNSVLLFDVELIDFTKGAKPGAAPAPAPTK
ncbi:FKBP-type peptidyl-prolyl cis-trans isomerase [Dyadobacter subterraneus]|uniref:Peptidyl-prolyl cis-trans isomerase n=1 Tax=Dyadobacter subterraneus TaxID=2773304 RepID=A0ABR9WIR3_9BACT|nr:FKBP-type peptidyl-prolyl cis-trans isomerase [Dyadobacter subterraneus]MBE9465325.1 FKBP-type peptidyl-prolyl cis-trans isomerase [Dyadobacter subterraneus]